LGRDPGFENPWTTRFKPGVTETGFINCYVMRIKAVKLPKNEQNFSSERRANV